MESPIFEQDFLTMISTLQNTFTKSEQKLANLVLEDPGKIVYMSISELAEVSQIGEATIIRFCRKLGCSGYYAFKMSLAKCLTSSPANMQNTGENQLEQNSTLHKIAFSVEKAIKDTLAILDPNQLKKVTRLLIEARNIKVYGIGSSSVAALDAKNRFKRIGYSIDSFTDGHWMSIDASLSTKEDVILGISYSGETIDIVEAFKIASKTGAKLVAITHFQKSYLAEYADAVLLTGSKEGPLFGGALPGKVAQMLVVEALFMEVFNSNATKYENLHIKTSNAIAGKIR